jgi:hypothetical protein
MARLTLEQRQDFIDHDGDYCPHCKGDLGDMIEAATIFEFCEGYLFAKRTCPSCSEPWRETYKLVDVHSWPPLGGECNLEVC